MEGVKKILGKLVMTEDAGPYRRNGEGSIKLTPNTW